MTTFTGYEGSGLDYTDTNVSGNVLDADDGLQVFDAWLADAVPDDGSMTNNLPISLNGVNVTGYRGYAGSGNDHWYYRVHIIPTTVDFGNILADATETFIVWNGWLDNIQLSSISSSGDTTGITLDATDTPPFTLPALEELTFSVDALVDGPSLIDLEYEFVFDTGEAMIVEVTGQRIFAWTFRPNWEGGVEERMEWATDVLTAYNGTEQRIALRTNPRRFLSYNFMLDNNADRRKFEAMLFNWGARTWLVPIWTEGNVLTSQLASGSSGITLDRASGDWQDARTCIIMNGLGAFDYEILRINTVVGTVVTFMENTSQTWPAGSVIYPASTALLENSIKLNRFTRSTEYGRCQMNLMETETVGAASETIYRTLPVITEAPHWQRDITNDYVRLLQEIDYKLGKFAYEEEATMAFQVVSHGWVCDGKDEIDALREFIYARAGKHKAVWLPTFTPDIELAVNASLSDSYIDVEHGFIAQHLWGHMNRRDIRIELLDGTVLYRRVTDVDEQSPTVERLTLDSALGVDFTVDEVDRISWMAVARLDTDSIQFQWNHDDWVECSVNWRTVRYDV